MNKEDRKLLKTNHLYLLNNLEIERVIEVLYEDARDILQDEDVAVLKSKATLREKRKALLELLPRRGPQAFQAFCDALEHENVKQKYIVDQLLGRASTPEGVSSNVQETRQLEERIGQMAIGGAGGGPHDDIGLDDTDGPIAVKVELCTEDFFNYKTSNSQPMCYTMVKRPRGVACIVSNTVFDASANLQDRRGGKVDLQNITALFKELGFEVRDLCDKTATEIETGIQSFTKEEAHKTANCCVVVMMSHGAPEHIYGRDGKLVNVPNIISMFNNKNCTALRGKPKLFFFQACRGQTVDKGTTSPAVPDSASLLPTNFLGNGQDEPDVWSEQPTNTDMLICYPTQLGNVSFRNASCGSWFIQALTKVFMQRAQESSILSMMTEVNRLVSEKTARATNPAYHGGKQASECIHRLGKELYFFPGITK